MGTAILCTEHETLHPHGFLVLLQAQFTKRPMVHLHCAYIIPLNEWVMSPQYTSVTFTSFCYIGYRIVGTHSGVKLCRWTKSMLRGRGGCYKHTFYGIESHRCMETTPSLACANKCVFCWRYEHSWWWDAVVFFCVEMWLPNKVVYSICSTFSVGVLICVLVGICSSLNIISVTS